MQKTRLFIIALTVGVVAGFIAHPMISEDNIFSLVRKFNRVLNVTSRNYVEEVDADKLTETAIKAMLEELDPHSVYIPPKNMEKVKEDFQGSFDGIGIEFNIFNDTITVVSPIAGGPSEALGIMSGDKIVKIDDSSAVGIEKAQIPKRLRGPKGTVVAVDIKREGVKELLHFDIVRDKIPLYSVDAAFIIENTDIGYLSINRFMATTYVEFMDSMAVLSSKGMKKLVLDLRGNPGGYLAQAYRIADEFIPKGHKIVFTKGRLKEFDQDFMSAPGGAFEQLPVISVINTGSASASEILSGALQDLDRGLVVGMTSFGKGLVQRQYELGDGSAFRLTTSKYYTPSGRCIQRPYEDKDKYRDFSDRLKEKEGKNLNHQIEAMKSEMHPDSMPPIYSTLNGRHVLGGGGITPDYVVKYDTITVMSRKIRAKNLFFIFTNSYVSKNRKSIEDKYQNNFSDFYKNFKVDDAMISDFRKLAESKEIEWIEKDFEIDQEYLRTVIKATIARSVWGNNEYRSVFLPLSRQINKAIELFPEAEEFARKSH